MGLTLKRFKAEFKTDERNVSDSSSQQASFSGKYKIQNTNQISHHHANMRWYDTHFYIALLWWRTQTTTQQKVANVVEMGRLNASLSARVSSELSENKKTAGKIYFRINEMPQNKTHIEYCAVVSREWERERKRWMVGDVRIISTVCCANSYNSSSSSIMSFLSSSNLWIKNC